MTEAETMQDDHEKRPSERPMIELRDIHISFGKTHVLKGIDLSVAPSEVCVLLGPSGSGKTTLLRCVNALTESDRGRIEVAGHVVRDLRPNGDGNPSARELCRNRAEIGFVFQQFNLFPHLTSLDNVSLGLRRVRGMSRASAEERAREMLDWVSLGHKADALPGHLSGGQKQRVAIARALAMKPKVMLFDEATSALDPELVGEVLEVMAKLARDGMTMMVVTHEIDFARKVADRIVFMENGNIVEEGPPSQVVDNPREARTARFLRHAHHDDI